MSLLRFQSRSRLRANTSRQLVPPTLPGAELLTLATRELIDESLPDCGEAEWTARVRRALGHYPSGTMPFFYLHYPPHAQLVFPETATRTATETPPATIRLNALVFESDAPQPLADFIELVPPIVDFGAPLRATAWLRPVRCKGRLVGFWLGEVGPDGDAGMLSRLAELEHWIAVSYEFMGNSGAVGSIPSVETSALVRWLSADSLMTLCSMAGPDFGHAHGVAHLLIVAHSSGWPLSWALAPWDESWRAVDEWFGARLRHRARPQGGDVLACPAKSARLPEVDEVLERAGFLAGASVETGRSTSYCVFWDRTGDAAGTAGKRRAPAGVDKDEEILEGHLWKQLEVALGNMARLEYLRELSHIDSITGVFNRRYFNLRLAEESSRARRSGRPLSLLVFDIDHFKELNDSMGHQAGDTVLHRVAEYVRSTMRSTDLFCRLSGDEFCILMPDTDGADCLRFGERLRSSLDQKRFVPGAGLDSVPVQISIGGAVFPQHASDAEAILWCADMALLEAKQRGRNRFLMYDPSMGNGGCPK